MSGSPFGEPMRAVALEQGEARGTRACSRRWARAPSRICATSAAIGSSRRPCAYTDRRRRPLRDRRAAGVRVAAAQRRADHDRLHARRVVPLARPRRVGRGARGGGTAAYFLRRLRPCSRRTARTMRRAPRVQRPTSAAMPRSARKWRTGLGRRRNSAARRRMRTFLRGGSRTRRASRSSITIRRRPALITRPRFRISCARRDSLNLFRQTRIWEDVDVALEEDMGSLLVSFARDGKPDIRARAGLAGIRPEAAAGRSARSPRSRSSTGRTTSRWRCSAAAADVAAPEAARTRARD